MGERPLIAHRHLPVGHALVEATGEDLVVDVGDVADKRHRQTGGLEPATQDVKRQP